MSYQPFLRNLILELARDGSTFGSFLFAALSCAAAACYDSRTAIRLAAGLAIVEAVGSLVKLVYHKQRPDRQTFGNLMEKIDAGSFPSIHCARMTMLAAVLSSLGLGAILAGGLAVLLTGWSRWFLKRHHPIDILAGCILGLCTGYLLLVIV